MHTEDHPIEAKHSFRFLSNFSNLLVFLQVFPSLFFFFFFKFLIHFIYEPQFFLPSPPPAPFHLPLMHSAFIHSSGSQQSLARSVGSGLSPFPLHEG